MQESLIFISGKKAILSYEWCACFGSEHLTAPSAASADRVRRSFVCDGSLSKHPSKLLYLIYL